MPVCSRIAPDRLRIGRDKGFALLITITLLAFLVLLLVSLASLTRVETSVAGNNQQIEKARQNALTSLNIALGQLQKYAGPDQRVTATADLAGTSTGNRLDNAAAPGNNTNVNAKTKGLSAVQAGTRFWTGAWGNSDKPADIFTKTPDPAPLNWLVSGNENTTFTANTSTGQITAASGASATYLPSMAVSPALTTSTTIATSLTIGGKNAVLLVGPATAGTTSRALDAPNSSVTETALDRYVVAPLVDIKAAAGSVPGLDSSAEPVVGRYAFWIGDEGVKIKYNARDAHSADTDLYTTSGARYRIASAQRNGVEAIPDLASYPVNGTALDKIVARPQMPMADSTVTTSILQGHFHDVSAVSRGVLADSLNGGLRQDLTWLLTDAGFAAAGLSGQSIIPSPYSPVQAADVNGTAISPSSSCPTWDWLKSFHDLPTQSGNSLAYGTKGSSATLKVQPATASQMGVAPVITQMRYHFSAKVSSASAGPVSFRTRFLLVLGNPYPVTLKSDQLTVRLSADDYYYDGWNGTKETAVHGFELYKTNTQITKLTSELENGFGPLVNGADYTDVSRINYDGHLKFPLLAAATHNATISGIGQSNKSLLGSVRFKISGINIPPGEQRVYSIQTPTTYTIGSSTDIPLTEDTSPYTGYIQTDVSGWGSIAASNSTATVDAYWMRMAGNGNYAVIIEDASGNVIKANHHIDIDGNQNWTRVQGWPRVNNPDNYYTIGGVRYFPVWPGDNGWGPKNRLQTYADYNLRSASMVMPRTSHPWAGFYSAPPYTNIIISALDAEGSSVINANMVSPPWGYDYLSGTVEEVVLFDVPRNNSANDGGTLQSIGFLQHANLTADDRNINVGHQPAAAVGNSRFSPFVSLNESVSSKPDAYDSATMRSNPADLPSSLTGTARFFDMSYLLNASLWDGSYFSTVPQTTSFTPGTGTLANNRLVFATGRIPTQTELGANGAVAADYSNGSARSMPGQYGAANYQMIDGAFNVNSTSIQAWKALLASLRKTALNNPDGTAWTASNLNAPFPRAVAPWAKKSSLSTGQAAEDYAGFRDLTDTQIQTLAEEIVRQVRLRGPFLSLSHFINRNLSASDATATGGAIQSAIEKNTASLNLASESNPDKITDGTEDINANGGDYYPTRPATTVVRSRLNGIPGWLSQADILQAIGPAISARSDTFTIRVYGEVRDPLDATAAPQARAWGEAVVQRCPDYVDTSELPSVRPSALTSDTNKNFGRRFRVVSFRWLSPDDI